MDLHLKNKVVMISGASKGIGRATALAFAQEGARLAICARGEQELNSTAEEIRTQTGAEVFACRTDLASTAETREFVSRTHRQFGRIDVLVNSAGQTKTGRFLELTEEEWMASWAGKYFGCVRICREVFKIMCDQRAGVIINVHGLSAWRPDEGFILKANVNAAVMNFTVGLANEGSKFGIRAHGVGPGYVRTSQTRKLDYDPAKSIPLGRGGDASEVADLILFFASDRASYIQGENISIDGGTLRTAR